MTRGALSWSHNAEVVDSGLTAVDGDRVASTGPYLERVNSLASHGGMARRVRETLACFDTAVLVARATTPALMSVALMDTVCPPSTVFAAYNAYGAEKELRTYPFDDHEGGQFHQEVEQLRWLEGRLR